MEELKSFKQEKFSRLVALDGLSISEAYKQSYNCENMKIDSIYQLSCRLSKQVKVTSRINELRDSVTSEVVANVAWTKERYLSELQVNLDGSRNSGAWPAANGSLQMIGKVTGHLSDKVTIESSLEATVNVIHKLPDAVLDQLAALSGSDSIDTGAEAAIIEAEYQIVDPAPEP